MNYKLKDSLLNIATVMIFLGFIDVIIRKFIQIPLLYQLNDYFWIISATLLILAITNKYLKCLAIIPLIIGITDEFLQYYNLYPDFLDKIYSSTGDILDVIAYICGFITALIIYFIFKKRLTIENIDK